MSSERIVYSDADGVPFDPQPVREALGPGLVRLPTRLRTSPPMTIGDDALDQANADFDARVRAIVHEEIASLAGKALRRTQDLEFSRDPARNLALEVSNEQMGQLWAEVLSEYRREET